MACQRGCRPRLRLTSTRVNRAEEDLDDEKVVVKAEVQGEVYVVAALVESRPAKLFPNPGS